MMDEAFKEKNKYKLDQWKVMTSHAKDRLTEINETYADQSTKQIHINQLQDEMFTQQVLNKKAAFLSMLPASTFVKTENSKKRGLQGPDSTQNEHGVKMSKNTV